jgi:hypothetical protein
MAHWFHGTSRQVVSLIEVEGLTVTYYGRDFQRFGEPLNTLRKLREHVADWYEAVVDLHVPDDEAPKYLTCLGTPKCCAGTMSGLLQPLPVRMVCTTEYQWTGRAHSLTAVLGDNDCRRQIRMSTPRMGRA